jgi:hypothetical protein
VTSYRERFRDRANDLQKQADQLAMIAKIPNHATFANLNEAADLLTKAAEDIKELTQAKLPGCVCPYEGVLDHNYASYVEHCPHHRDLFLIRQRLKEQYAWMEKALKNEVRMGLVRAALTGAAESSVAPNRIVAFAILIADEAIRQIGERAKS